MLDTSAFRRGAAERMPRAAALKLSAGALARRGRQIHPGHQIGCLAVRNFREQFATEGGGQRVSTTGIILQQ